MNWTMFHRDYSWLKQFFTKFFFVQLIFTQIFFKKITYFELFLQAFWTKSTFFLIRGRYFCPLIWVLISPQSCFWVFFFQNVVKIFGHNLSNFCTLFYPCLHINDGNNIPEIIFVYFYWLPVISNWLALTTNQY